MAGGARIEPVWSVALRQSAITFVGTAAFPRIAYRLRWPTRLGPRGFIAYAAFNTLALFAIRTWVLPYVARVVEESQRLERELREQLGREPTEDDFLAYHRRKHEARG